MSQRLIKEKINGYFSLKGPKCDLDWGLGRYRKSTVEANVKVKWMKCEVWSSMEQEGFFIYLFIYLENPNLSSTVSIHCEWQVDFDCNSLWNFGEICQFSCQYRVYLQHGLYQSLEIHQRSKDERVIWSFMMPKPARSLPAGHDVRCWVFDAAIPSSQIFCLLHWPVQPHNSV